MGTPRLGGVREMHQMEVALSTNSLHPHHRGAGRPPIHSSWQLNYFASQYNAGQIGQGEEKTAESEELCKAAAQGK